MRRREVMALLAGATLARAARAEAPPGAVVGFVGGALPPEHLQIAFHRGLNEAGYVEGRNVKFENRWVADNYAALPAVMDLLCWPRPRRASGRACGRQRRGR